MDIMVPENKEATKNNFDALSFERKLVEMVEELRLRRNLEAENEKILKSLMDEKHKTEIEWDEKHRRHSREKSELEQQITMLNRKLEDKHCGLDDEKAKQQLMNKTYSEEIRLLKEELRKAHSEKLTFVKRIQELEGQLNLKNKFQESIMDQIAEIKRRSKSVSEECGELSNTQTKMLENVSDVKIYIRNIEMRIDHVQEITAISKKKNEELKNELVTAKSEIVMLKNSAIPIKQISGYQNTDLKKLNEKYSELEKLLVLTQKENEKTLNNFLESNKLLCETMNKYAYAQENEKSLEAKIEACENEIETLKRKEEDLQKELIKSNADNDFTRDHRSVDKECKGTQTLNDIPVGKSLENKIVEVDLVEVENSTNSVTSQSTKTELFSDKICTNATNDASDQVSNKFTSFKENGTVSFGSLTKRKLNLMDDDESDGPPKKLFRGANVVDSKSDWQIENQGHRLFNSLIEDEKSVPSSFNSLEEDIGLSQEKQENGECNESVNVDAMRDEKGDLEVGDVKTIDVTSVQMDLKELKVCDGGTTSNEVQNGSRIQGKEN